MGAPHLAGRGDVARAEALLRAWYGMPHAACVSSATTGMHALALAIGTAGRDVIVPPLGWGGVLAPWFHAGSVVLFGDVEPRGLTLDPARVHEASRSPAAIVAVEQDGHPCDDSALLAAARSAGATLVVDAASSLGSLRAGRPSGRLADAVVVSFGPGKPVDAGEGGAVLTRDRDLHERIVWWTQHPDRQSRELGRGVTNALALNGRMHPRAAAAIVGDWEASLERAAGRRRDRSRLLRRLVEVGAVIDVRALGEASHAGLSVVPRAGRAPVIAALREAGVAATARTMEFLPERPEVAAAVPDAAAAARRCVVARRECRRRIVVSWRTIADLTDHGGAPGPAGRGRR